MTTRNHAQPLTAPTPLRALSIAVALALAPSLTGYLYLNPLRASLVTIGLPDIWAYYLCILRHTDLPCRGSRDPVADTGYHTLSI